jgi:hypothetical protein
MERRRSLDVCGNQQPQPFALPITELLGIHDATLHII